MDDLKFSPDELIQALLTEAQKLENKQNQAMTVVEIMTSTGWSQGRVYNTLKELKAAGKIEPVKVLRENLSGTWHAVPAYAWKGQEHEA